jgi:hypothetical protein
VEGALRVVRAREEASQVESVTKYVAGSLIVGIVSGLICVRGQCHQEGHWASGESLAL